jgi:hypothetical protein
MKKLVTMALIVASMSAAAQEFGVWRKVQTKDEFGDTTGVWMDQIIIEGFFSNSAVHMELMAVVVNDYGTSFGIHIFEYQRPPSVKMCRDGCFGKVVVKRESGEVKVYDHVFSASGGTIFFDEEDDLYKLFRSASGESIKVFIKEETFNEYGSATYIFEITLR